jgi:hypothetical protein
MLKYEFDNWKEFEIAMNNLDKYHDCNKCHGKIVCIISDNFGNTKCGYCNKLVKYPKIKKEAFKELLKEINGKNN